MTILTCPSPSNINPLNPNGFLFSVTKLPELTFFVQDVELPSLTIGTIIQSSSVHDIKIPGETADYGSLTVSFLVDEQFANYKAIYAWMIGLTYPETHAIYTDFLASNKNENSYSELAKGYSDATLTILDSSNNPIQSITFVDAYPTSLSSLPFSSQSSDVQYLRATATFEYTYYKTLAAATSTEGMAGGGFGVVSGTSIAGPYSRFLQSDASGNFGSFTAGTITANLVGNATTATKLQTARTINGVSFDGTSNITIETGATAETITGTILAPNVTGSSLTSVGTLSSLAVTGAITGASFNSITGLSATEGTVLSTAAIGVSTTAARADHAHPVQTTISGNAGTSTALQTARNINGVSFNGTTDITVTAAAGTLTGNTLASNVTGSSLTSVGTLGSLAVTGAVTGASFNSITGLSSTEGTALGIAAAGVATAAARADHVHPVQTTISGNANNVTGVVAITNGGTGATTAVDALTALGAYAATNPSGYTSNTGTVTSVGGTGTVSGLTLTGSVITSGNLTLGGTLAVAPSDFSSQTANTVLSAPNGTAGTPTFRALVAADIPNLDAAKITSGTISASVLPSYVDDVIEVSSLSAFPVTGETGKIYVALDTNKTYRWSGSVYVYITSGAVDSVAGKTGVVTLTSSDVGLGNVTNESKATMFSSPTFTGTVSGITSTMVGLGNVENKSSETIRGEITSSNVTTALGFTPYNSTNPSGYTTNVGTVTDVTGTAPIVSSGGTAPVISISAATTLAAGSMSAADKTKLDGIASGATANVGTVTSVGGTGTVSGLTLSGTVTTSGDLTLGGTLEVTAANFASQTANTVLAAPNGSAGSPTFRALVASDVPTLNQNTSGTAAGLSSTLAITSGGTGETTAGAAFNALSPITATGDLIIGSGTNNAIKLTIGANSYVLTSDGTTATWQAPTGGGGFEQAFLLMGA